MSYKVLLVDTDHAVSGLIEEWLAGCGCNVAMDGADSPAAGRVDVVVVDVPFPRQGGLDVLQRIAAGHPGTPILALSSAFFAGVEGNGAVARSLGVAAVLPKPVGRDALINTVGSLLAASKHTGA